MLHEQKGGVCRVCGTQWYRSLHHVVSRSLGGDDVADNLVPLCGTGTTGCHGLVEAGDPWACTRLAERLSAGEWRYVVGKKGVGFMERRYGIKEAA